MSPYIRSSPRSFRQDSRTQLFEGLGNRRFIGIISLGLFVCLFGLGFLILWAFLFRGEASWRIRDGRTVWTEGHGTEGTKEHPVSFSPSSVEDGPHMCLLQTRSHHTESGSCRILGLGWLLLGWDWRDALDCPSITGEDNADAEDEEEYEREGGSVASLPWGFFRPSIGCPLRFDDLVVLVAGISLLISPLASQPEGRSRAFFKLGKDGKGLGE